MSKYYTGSLFFTYEGETPIYYRLIKPNGEYFTMLRLDNGEITKKKIKEWESMLGFIKPNAFIAFDIVETPGNNEDVIVAMFKESRMTDPSPTSQLPYCICRQNVKDIFAEMYGANKNYFGCSISEDTCPTTPTFTYQDLLSCTKIKKQCIVAVYLEDTIDDILNRVPHSFRTEADKSLLLNYSKHATSSANCTSGYAARQIYKKIMEADSDVGYVKTLEALLKVNSFIDDVYKGLGVLPVVYDFGGVNANLLTKEQCEGLSKHIRCNIVSGGYIKYAHDIDLNTQKDYLLLMDKNNILYVVLLNIKGEYHTPVEDIETPENIGKLSVLLPTKSVIEAARIIRPSNAGDKYKS